jgi:septum formation protein
MLRSLSTTSKEIILASASPRRKAYFEDLGLPFRVLAADIEEKRGLGETAMDYVQRLAAEKAAWVADSYPQSWVVAADTVVVHGELILEKPQSRAEAVEMLLRLSGGQHTVHTGMCLLNKDLGVRELCQVSSRVVFWDVGRELIEAYVQTGEPMDKAGSYGIQGIGAFLVREIHGSYSNVVGLPLSELLELLIQYKLLANG